MFTSSNLAKIQREFFRAIGNVLAATGVDASAWRLEVEKARRLEKTKEPKIAVGAGPCAGPVLDYQKILGFMEEYRAAELAKLNTGEEMPEAVARRLVPYENIEKNVKLKALIAT